MTTNQNHPDDHLAIEALHSRYLDVLTGRTSDHLLMFQDEARTWPDWRTAPADRAIEHDRADEPVDDNTYFVMRNAGGAVFVKHGPFFRDQGGLTQDWGKGWTRIKASSIEHARQVGEELLP
ncbi:hypothetical protein ACS2R3_004307 [Pseudomonas aeruginosa]